MNYVKHNLTVTTICQVKQSYYKNPQIIFRQCSKIVCINIIRTNNRGTYWFKNSYQWLKQKPNFLKLNLICGVDHNNKTHKEVSPISRTAHLAYKDEGYWNYWLISLHASLKKGYAYKQCYLWEGKVVSWRRDKNMRKLFRKACQGQWNCCQLRKSWRTPEARLRFWPWHSKKCDVRLSLQCSV